MTPDKTRTRRTNGLRARAWWVLRKNKAMTLVEIQATLCTGTEKDPVPNLRRYFKELVAVGIMGRERIDDGKPTSNGSYLYSVIRNVGPLAPIVRGRDKQVYDPNAAQIMPRLDAPSGGLGL